MKNRIHPTLVLTVLAFLFSTTPAQCQQADRTSVGSNATTLPEAPSSATTCTEKNGKPCPEWVHKLVGPYPRLPESKMPEAVRDPASVHFWTYRGLQDPPLRSNKEVFRSKVFLAAHVGGAVAMIVACRTKNSGEDWGSEVPAVSALFVLDYVQFRFVGGPNAMIAPVYEMIRYGRASR